MVILKLKKLLEGAGELVGVRSAVVKADKLHASLVVPTVVDRHYLHAFPRANPLDGDDGPVLSRFGGERLLAADSLLSTLAGEGVKSNDPLSSYPLVAEYNN